MGAYNEHEEICEGRETIRTAIATGCAALKAAGAKTIVVDDLDDAEAAAEGAKLSTWQFEKYKSKQSKTPEIEPLVDCDAWRRGAVKADGQNFARMLTDTPANLMTPTIFADVVKRTLEPLNVCVEVRDEQWAKAKKMESFLSVAQGSEEPAKFLEITYRRGGSDQPMVFVGKGVTFDTGGISIKPSQGMDAMRGDMGGAASVVGALYTAAKLELPVHLKALIPLCENMPSGKATKPGDVVYAMNGKSICVNNTDAEGRLILADALCYSAEFQPKWVVDVATLTGAIMVGLGNAAAGTFTNSTRLWEVVQRCGASTGDRMWRMPLWLNFSQRVTHSPAYDVDNIAKGKGGGSCTAAAFLKEFAPEGVDWMHIDIAGVSGPEPYSNYLTKGMTGRPTRTLVELIMQEM